MRHVILAFVLLAVHFLSCAGQLSSAKACGIAVTVGALSNGSASVLALNVSTAAVLTITVPLNITGYPAPAEYFIAETGDYFFFAETLAFSANVITGKVTAYSSWLTPAYTISSLMGPMYYYMNFAGYDTKKGVIYGYNILSAANLTHYGFYVSNIQEQNWSVLAVLEVPMNYSISAALSMDKSSIAVLLEPQLPGFAVYLDDYDIGSNSWSARVQINPKYGVEPGTPPVSLANGNLLLWLYTGRLFAAASYNVTSGGQSVEVNVPAFQPSGIPSDPTLVTASASSQLLVPGCPLELPSNSTFFVLLYDANAGSVAYNFPVRVGRQTIWNTYCNYAWTASGCLFV